MVIINACGAALSPSIARAAVIPAEREPTMAVMHSAQVVSLTILYELVALESVQIGQLTDLEDIESVKQLAQKYQPKTFMGMEIVRDDAMPTDVIEFRDADGVISKIVSLAIPVGFPYV